MSDSLVPGGEFGAYRIERMLGRGGMSTVYLAEHVPLKRKVAIKVLSHELAADERFRDRFVRESELAASLDEPNVLPVYEAGEHDGVLFIAMRFVDGTDLRGLIDETGPLSAGRTADIVDQVARALDAAHAKGLVHRDVKPGNILIARGAAPQMTDHVYLSDFGLTKRASSRSGITGTGVFVGTLDYAAPEQFEGRTLDARTDVYSLGCVLFECLTGAPPFRKEQDAALMYAHLHEPPPSLTASRPDLPPGVDRVVQTAMAKRPEQRFASAGALSAALREALPDERGLAPARPSKAGWWITSAAAIVVIATLVVLLARAGSTDAGLPSTSPTAPVGSVAGAPPPSSLALIDPDTGGSTLTVRDLPGLAPPLRIEPSIAVGEGGVWLYSGFATLSHVDEETGAVREQLQINYAIGARAALAVGSRTVWFIGADELTRVSRINPSTDELLKPVSLHGGSATDLVIGDGALWVGSSDGTLTKFDPLTGRRLDRFAVGATPDALAFAEGSVWVLDVLHGEVVRVRADDGSIAAHIPVSGSLADISAGNGGIWVLDKEAGIVTQIDPATNTPLAPLRVGPGPSAIAVGLGSAWVTDAEDGRLYRLDPELGSQEPIDVGAPLGPIAIDENTGAIWVGILDTGS